MNKSPASLDDDALTDALRGALKLADAPAPLVAAAVSLWPTQAATAPTGALASAVQQAVRKVRAVLTFDSWTTTPSALGLRSAGLSRQTRHLMFSADGRDIDLRIVSAANSYVLAGQILGPEERGSIEISVDTSIDRDGPPPRIVDLDDMGSFELESVRAGTYWMTLRFDRDVIELPPIDVGHR